MMAGTDPSDARATERDRRLRASIVAASVSRALSIVAALALTPVVIRGAGVTTFGVYATITSIAGFLLVMDFGVGGGLVARMSHAAGRDDDEEPKRLVTTALVLMTGLAAVLGAALVVVAHALPLQSLLGAQSFPRSEVLAAVVVFLVAMAVGIPAAIGDRVLVATQRGAQASIWMAMSGIAAVAATALVAAQHGSLAWLVGAAVVTPRLIALVQTVWVLRFVEPSLWPGSLRRFDPRAARKLLSAGGLFFAQTAAVAIAYETDILIVSSRLGAEAAATYNVTLRLVGVVGIFTGLALAQLLPAYGEALARGDLAWVRRTLRRTTLFLLAGLTVLGTIGLALAPPFIELWAGEEVVPPMSLLAGLIVWTGYQAALVPMSLLLNAALIIRAQVLLALAMAALNLPLSWWLTGHLGVSGPAWGSCIAHVAVSLGPAIYLVRRVLRGQALDNVTRHDAVVRPVDVVSGPVDDV